MKILVDDEGKKIVMQLCDIALKQGGMGNFTQIQTILSSTKDIPDEKPTTKELKNKG